MNHRHTPRRRTLLALAMSAAIAVGAIALGGTLSGCGQKGPLYLPKQKKSRVPETPSNTAPDTAPDTAPIDTPSGDQPSPTSDPTPPA